MARDSIIRLRLTSLRKSKGDAAARAERKSADLARRAEDNGVDVETQRRIDLPNTFARDCRPMPLAFYYGQDSVEGRDAAFMRRRVGFYAMCARVFGFAGWDLDGHAREIALAAQMAEGRDGRDLRLLPIDRGSAVNINANSAPLEYLVSQNWLETKADPHGYGMLRFAAALRFRGVVQGSQSGGLKGQAYEGSGGGFGPRLVSDHALDCMALVSAVRGKVPAGLFALLHQVVVDDVWVWEAEVNRIVKGVPARERAKAKDRPRYDKMRKALLKKRRESIILRVHQAIDGAAIVFDYMSEEEYRRRWLTRQSRAPSSRR